MPPRHHRIPDDVLTRLAAGGGGAEAARHLAAAEWSKRRLLVLRLARLAADSGHPHAEAADHAYDVLAEVEKKRPDAVRTALGHPAVGAWAAQTVGALERGRTPALGPGHLGAVAAVAALKAGMPCRTEAPAPGGDLALPALGRLSLPGPDVPDLVEVHVHADGRMTAGGVRLRPGQGEHPGWRPLHRLATADGRLSLLVDDLHPFRWTPSTLIEGRLPEPELPRWQECLESAWQTLRRHHWTIADETRELVSVLTPVQGPAQGMNSASAADRFGTVAMSTPPDGRWLASTFAHEVQHAKLGAILDVLRLLEPDDVVHYAPWRPDPRPLSGLVQGAYAYLGVSGFWRRQREHESDLRPHIEFARWRESAYAVTGTLLDSGRLTDIGERFVSGMRATLAAWLAEPVPPAALDEARREAEAHLDAWRARNPGFSPDGGAITA
ncbi:HEXXH motif domain-containing protein [Nonomuraea spiralis]|uniref:HEXXH motif domain-containing protein n=1 Tax=Nonomuraea spiralis TaxID=46182 RepID=A0ABV5IEJ4_9ACTN|nr:HEXXH motif domain-containing protein [Nonomuraea spiralis]GGS68158.1 HEXXH motif domain-containing protein [Nonomuraea spiralis]